MFKLNYYNLFPVFILLFSVHLGVIQGSDKIVENFHDFSELLEESFSESPEASETRPGVHFFNSFGVGYTLANIQQGVWNISAKGIPSALKTVEKYIPDDYGHLLRLFKKNKFKITSTIYSRYGNGTKDHTSALSTLMSHLITLDYVTNPAKFVDSFSSLMDTGTKGHLDNELLPKGLWQSVFDNTTQGAYINTMHFKAQHPVAWVKVGEKAFNSEAKVSFLEVEGEFPLFESENVTVVIVDIGQTPPKQLVLAKSRQAMYIPQLKKEVRQIVRDSFNKSLFVPTMLRVQVPAISVTNLARHHLGLSLMGVEETFCNTNGTGESSAVPEVIQQPIAQANHFEFAPTHIELTSATGSAVALNTGELDHNLEEEYDDEDIDSILVNEDEDEFDSDVSLFRAALKFDPNSHRTKTAVTSKLLKRLNLQPPKSPDTYSVSPLTYHYQKRGRNLNLAGRNLKEEQCRNPDDKTYQVVTTPGTTLEEKFDSANPNNITTLTFDTPFMFVLQDETLGETFSGFVSSLCEYNKVTNSLKTSSIHAWLHDVFKVAFWKCY